MSNLGRDRRDHGRIRRPALAQPRRLDQLRRPRHRDREPPRGRLRRARPPLDALPSRAPPQLGAPPPQLPRCRRLPRPPRHLAGPLPLPRRRRLPLPRPAPGEGHGRSAGARMPRRRARPRQAPRTRPQAVPPHRCPSPPRRRGPRPPPRRDRATQEGSFGKEVPVLQAGWRHGVGAAEFFAGSPTKIELLLRPRPRRSLGRVADLPHRPPPTRRRRSSRPTTR